MVPVLSRISGNVFEKRLLDSYIAENKKDPVTGEEMGPEDVVEIKASRVVRPRPPNATSIPSLLSIFQNEWDALALETYHLKRQLHQTRQELSTALYQHDAACRVIARISQERDEAREALSKVSENMSLPVAQPMEIDGDQPIPTVIVDIVKETLQEESAKRKKRKVPENWTTAEQLSGLKQHKATKANLKNLELPGAASSGVLNASHPSKQFEIIGAGSEWYITSNEQEQYRSHQDSGKIESLMFRRISTNIFLSDHIARNSSGRSPVSSWLRRRRCQNVPSSRRKSCNFLRTSKGPYILCLILREWLLACCSIRS